LVLDYLKSINIDKQIYKQYKKIYSRTVVKNYNKFENKYKKLYYKAVKNFCQKYNPTFLEKIEKPETIFTKIFSIKNSENITHKIISILGIKIKIKKQTPCFSIIMPTYNRNFCIEKAIKSLLNQTYSNWELIIIDDGSTDGTQDFIHNKYADYIKNRKIIYKYIPHSGVCIARNIGLKLAQYPWIAYLDSDNEILSNYLAVFAHHITRNNKIKIYYAKIERTNGKTIGKIFNLESLYHKNYIDLGVFVHNKSLVKKYGIFDTNLKRLVDWDLIIRYTRNNKPYFINKVLLKYNDNPNYERISTTENLEESKEIIFNKIKNYKEKEALISKIFSIKNDDIRKVITIGGIKIKFKSKKLIERKRISDLEKKVKKQDKQIKELSVHLNSILQKS
jgi:glycosyltransferase involved in cell wall biosynthesis